MKAGLLICDHISTNYQAEFGDYPDKFEIRGEIVLPFEGFNKMNEERITAGEEPYRNPRNTASGSLKLQDSAEVAKRPLECLLYNIKGNNTGIKTQFENLEKARSWGFKVPTCLLYTSPSPRDA